MILILLSCIICNVCAISFPGLHFHSDRVRNKQNLDEMRKHREDPGSTWIFDFEKDSHCARIDIEPFVLPSKFTTCYKSNHDFVDDFIFLSFLSTKSGNSLVEDFKNRTYSQMMRGDLVNLVTLLKSRGWRNYGHLVGDHDRASNGFAYDLYGFQRWEQWCVAFDLEVGQTFTYVDGVYDGAEVSLGTYFISVFI